MVKFSKFSLRKITFVLPKTDNLSLSNTSDDKTRRKLSLTSNFAVRGNKNC